MEKDVVYWHLPGLCNFGVVNQILFDAMRKYPQMFREGYKIGSVYGTFPMAIWNGGRIIPGTYSSEKEVENVIKSYNVWGIPARFTWTNVLLEEKHMSDTYCNMIMKKGNNGVNQVLVNSPVLEEYIRKTYPKYKVLSSTTKRILSPDRLMEELDKDYYLVVLDYDLNHNEKIIEQITPRADKIEILVNETCQPNCPNRVNHYREISKCSLDHSEKMFNCTDSTPGTRTFKGCMRRPQFMSTTDVEEYSKKGFRNFKIVGRGLSFDFYLDSIVYYLVKVENRDFIRRYISELFNRFASAQNIRM